MNKEIPQNKTKLLIWSDAKITTIKQMYPTYKVNHSILQQIQFSTKPLSLCYYTNKQPRINQCTKKSVYTLVFLLTEIFSKRRKFYSIWGGTWV